jgi:hypothetical protein
MAPSYPRDVCRERESCMLILLECGFLVRLPVVYLLIGVQTYYNCCSAHYSSHSSTAPILMLQFASICGMISNLRAGSQQ